jgi:hypothetical protein
MTRAHLSYRIGIRFHRISPDPFLSVGWENTAYFGKSWIYYGDRAYYYLDRHLDNRLFANYQRRLSERAVFSFENSYRYQEYIQEHQLTHSLVWYRSISQYKFVSPRLTLYVSKAPTHNFTVDYYYAGVRYHDRFYRNWLFYEVEPGLIWRREKGYESGLRCMFRIGITFERN